MGAEMASGVQVSVVDVVRKRPQPTQQQKHTHKTGGSDRGRKKHVDTKHPHASAKPCASQDQFVSTQRGSKGGGKVAVLACRREGGKGEAGRGHRQKICVPLPPSPIPSGLPFERETDTYQAQSSCHTAGRIEGRALRPCAFTTHKAKTNPKCGRPTEHTQVCNPPTPSCGL
jgi:hypothetical protein